MKLSQSFIDKMPKLPSKKQRNFCRQSRRAQRIYNRRHNKSEVVLEQGQQHVSERQIRLEFLKHDIKEIRAIVPSEIHHTQSQIKRQIASDLCTIGPQEFKNYSKSKANSSLELHQIRSEWLRLQFPEVRAIVPSEIHHGQPEFSSSDLCGIEPQEFQKLSLAQLTQMRQYFSQKRVNAPQEINQSRLQHMKDYSSKMRSIESQEIRLNRLESMRQHASELRDNKRTSDRQKHRKVGILQEGNVFLENELVDGLAHHELPSLFNSISCVYCKSLRWQEERTSFCCSNGKIKLNQIPSPPEVLKNLYKNEHFLSKIRMYNNSLSLASLGIGKEIIQHGFSPTVTIQGKIYHLIDNLLPTEGNIPKFAQLYFHDSENEVYNRLHHNPGLEVETLAVLQEMLHRYNPYVCSLKAAIEIQEACHENLQIVLNSERKPSDGHARIYNLPTGSEVAVLLPGELSNDLDVILHTRNGPMQRINQLHRAYDPLHYILLFPLGDNGYHLNIPHSRGSRNVTPVEYYRYLLQVKSNDENFIMKSRRLLQQFACDQYAKVENERLKYIKFHQKEIRADKYQGLMDALFQDDTVNVGKKIILPPSVYGSPRFYAEAFQDAMAIVRHYGKPSLFITFTTNPKWPEIEASLFPGEKSRDRPDICARVFNIKLEELLKDLHQREVLGKVLAFTSVKEDQKRGLPHAHILLILSDVDQPKTPQQIDCMVCAEIPDKTTNPRLYDVITRNNIHGPCGAINPHSPCMVGEGALTKCGTQFPKDFRNHTIVTKSAYPEYRRRSPEEGGNVHKMKVRGNYIDIDNRFIVPYNPFLSLKYNSHINVEIVHSVKAVKYLYKYITKGCDRVMMRLGNGEEVDITNNEIERFVNARYISASQAFWRLYEFKIHHRYPAVMKLPCHLENEQFVLFTESDAADIGGKGPPRTKLTEWFELNRADINARTILYTDIPKHYTWKENQWQSRKYRCSINNNGTYSDMIGRIPVITLNAHQSELYFLRMLLHHKAGATSYKDLRTVEGEMQPTFQAACLKLGLLYDDGEIDKVIVEAASYKFSNQLRDVFANILIWVRPVDPLAFYERHKNLLVEDFLHRDHLKEPNEMIFNELLIYLQERLERENLDLKDDFGLPKPDFTTVSSSLPLEIREEIEQDTEALRFIDANNRAKLNEEQLEVYETVISSVDNDEGLLISLDASGGTGKTFVLSTILAHVRSKNDIAIATATSGIAATLLPKGRTLHSRLKIPINITDDSTCNITLRSATAELIRRCKLLVIDEVSMADRRILEAVDRSMKDIRKNDRTFGGITVVLAGDWRQILPVVRNGSRAEIVNACIKSSPLWSNVKVMKLTTNMRVAMAGADQCDYASYLLDIGNGKLDIDETLGKHKVKIKEEFVSNHETFESFADFVFEDLQQNYKNREWLTSRAILCPTNDAVDKVNTYLINKFPGVGRLYRSSDTIEDCEDAHQYPEEFLNSLNPAGIPPHKIVLKKYSPIILLRNIDPIQGHCNGTKYIVTHLNDHVIDATIASGMHVGKKLFIPRISLSSSENIYPFQLQRRQFPVRLAFAMTSNKAQGQTLERVGIYLEKDFFSHGQLYVSMSRVGQPGNVKIFTKNGKFPNKEGTYTDNVVFHEIL